MSVADTPALLEEARRGDNDACARLIEENAGLIWSIVRRYYGRGTDPEDLYQLGCLGFLKAVRGFDPAFGCQFSTYAVPKIAGEIRRFLRDDGAVKVSRGLKERAGAIRSARERLSARLGREPALSELAEETGLEPEEIAAAEEAVTGQEAIPVFVFDMAQEEGAYTCGNNFTSKLIEHAGGVNIFNDLDTTWATVSWETVVERAPEVIIIDDYGDTSLEEKIAQLKENPALATVPAIQNDRIISVTLCESFASSMTGDTVEKFARAFHPDCFA